MDVSESCMSKKEETEDDKSDQDDSDDEWSMSIEDVLLEVIH